ncbi:MAG: alpha/beta hydrolase, partial [Pseudomonadota bacterium]
MTRLSAPVADEGMLATERLRVSHLRTRPPSATAPKVLLLGGSNFDLRLKRSFLHTSLAAQCELATYEPRGIGRTDQPDGPWVMEDYARDALAVLDALGWPEAIVVGESFGGMTALHLALMAPSRIQRLVIASAGAGGPHHASFDISTLLRLPRDQAAHVALFLQDTRNALLCREQPDVFAERLAERLDFETAFETPSVTNGGYARLLKARQQHDCTRQLSKITIPTTVIAGCFDRQAPPEVQRALADRLPNADFHLFEAGHSVLFGLPDATQTALDAIMRTNVQQPQLQK